MAKVREYDFPTGYETSTIPDPGTPSAANDTVSKGYADTTYTPRASVYGGVSDITALKAIGSSSRFNQQVIWVSGKTSFYEFNSSSSATGDDDTIVQPTSGSGRWLKQVVGGAGASSGGASGVEALEQKLNNELNLVFTDALDNSVGSSFAYSKATVSGRLLADYTSGTTMHIAWNPLYINNSDKNTDSTTGWAVQGAGATLTTSVTKKIGTASLSFDKNNTGTNARIRNDIGSASMGVAGFTDLFFWINMPSITGFLNVEVRIDVDGTNFQTYTTATDHTGASIAAGWNLVKIDLSSAGSTSGTGWDTSKLFRYLHIGVNTSSSAQTYTAILIDAIHFSQGSVTQLVQLGNQYSINDTSNVENFIIDSASARVAGTITIAAGLSNAYNGGTNSEARRSTMVINGDQAARMEQSLSGNIAKTQTAVLQRVLPASLTAQNFKAFTDINSNCIFRVLTVASSTQITVDDPADQHLNIISGQVIHVFKPNYNADGLPNFENRGIDLTVTSSTWSGGVLTINTGTNTGIAVGDYVALKTLTTKLSVVATSANENFVTPTTDSTELRNLGIPYPNSTQVFAHWPLSGASGYKKKFGAGVDLTYTGSLTFTNAFRYGQMATSGWSDSNYLSLSASDSSNFVSGFDFSFWFYAPAFTGTSRVLLERFSASTGWQIFLQASANNVQLQTNASTAVTLAFTPNQWNHVAVRVESSVDNHFYLNGVKSTVSNGLATNPSTTMFIGRSGSAGISAGGVFMTDVLFLANSTALTAGQVAAIYAAGAWQGFGLTPLMKYRYSQNSLTGQKISIYNEVSRQTDTAIISIPKTGIIKS